MNFWITKSYLLKGFRSANHYNGVASRVIRYFSSTDTSNPKDIVIDLKNKEEKTLMRMPIVGRKVEISSAIFGEMVRNNCALVDKTLLIKEFFEGQKVSLITRPRRFGKTMNMSMIQHFCASEVEGELTEGLFKDFAIAKADGGKWIKQHQGKYPVIFISFKDVDGSSYDEMVRRIRGLIKNLYEEHESQFDLVDSPSMKKSFNEYLNGESNDGDLQDSLRFLSKFLFKAYKKRAIILIDEYDTPLTHAYQKNYLDDISIFFRNMYSATLKDNGYLEKGLMTGILRVSKNQMLSGLNNLMVYTLFEDDYNQYFGFTEGEVKELMEKFPKGHDFDKVKEFYNGYVVGTKQTLFNPYSLMNYFRSGKLSTFWVSTSTDDLLEKLFLGASSDTKKEFACLMKGESIKGNISVNTSYEALMNRPEALWTLLLFTGYLTYIDKADNNADIQCNLRIPNREVLSQYNTIFTNWLKRRMGSALFEKFRASLHSGDVKGFIESLGEHLSDSLSCRDVGDVKGESFYHDFMVCMTGSVNDTHYVDFNKESGKGYYDLLLTPKEKGYGNLAVIFELKYVRKGKSSDKTSSRKAKGKKSPILFEHDVVETEQSFENVAVSAVKQIEENEYAEKLKRSPHVTRVLAIGLAFRGKNVVSAYKVIDLQAGKADDISIIKRCMHNRDNKVSRDNSSK